MKVLKHPCLWHTRLYGMGLQSSTNIGDGLSSFLTEDGMDANRTGKCHVLLDIVEEDDLCWLHVKHSQVSAKMRLSSLAIPTSCKSMIRSIISANMRMYDTEAFAVQDSDRSK